MTEEIEQQGFAMAREVVDEPMRAKLVRLLGTLSGAGRRGLLELPEIVDLAKSEHLLELLRPHLAADPFPVRAIYFDKSAEANWLVPWHQDVTLAVEERIETPGFGPWSVKDGIPHVQPPAEYLERMLTIRLHLDPADATNGALRVLPGTHRFGRLSSERIQALRSEIPETLCVASSGDALLMRPLLIHASSRSTSERHRRILHLEYASFPLPGELRWHEGG